jgi:biotin-(acetyl-CoA carboxylase) ligase
MGQKVQDILKKINYIEADMEIQKQILFSIPSADTDEMEKTLKIIADKKAMIADLREQIKAIDPEEFNRILVFEKASEQFRQLTTEKKFVEITTLNEEEQCSIQPKVGKIIDCIVKATDEAGNFTVITLDGEIVELSKEDVIA